MRIEWARIEFLIDLEAEINLVCRRPNRVLGRQRRGHGDYWGHSGKPPCTIAADRIAEFFQFGSWERTIAARGTGAPRPESADNREAGEARTV